MKKILLFIAALMWVSLCAFSQTQLSKDFSYKIGKPYKVIDTKEKYFYHVGGDILTAITDEDVLTLQKFDTATLGEVKKTDISNFPKGFGWEEMTALNDKFIVFYNSYDKEKNVEQLFYRELDPDNVTLGDDKLLCSVSGKVTGTLYGKMFSVKTRDKFIFHYSYDSSKILINYRKKPLSDEAHDSIGLMVYDNNLKQLWSKVVKMPYGQKKMENLQYGVDSEGNVYILSAVSNGSTDIKKCVKGKGECHGELLRIKANTSEVSKTNIEINKEVMHDITLFESPKNYMVGAGFYSNAKETNKSNASGIFIFKAGKEGAIYDAATFEIPLEILNQYASQKTQNKNDKKEEKGKAEFEDLMLDDVKIMADGSIILMGEQHYDIVITHATSSGGTTTQTTYYYNDILVTKIGADNKLAWMRKLPKRQKGNKGLGGMSYKYIKGKDNYYFLFLDNVKNHDLAINEVPAYHVDGEGGFLTAYKVSIAKGDVSKDYIFDTKDVKGTQVYQFKTARILSISPTEFVVEVYKKEKEDEMIKITLNGH